MRFFDSTRRSRDQPGPGAYNPSDIQSTDGSYIISNFRNTGNVKFIKPKLGLRSKTPLNARQSKYRFQISVARNIIEELGLDLWELGCFNRVLNSCSDFHLYVSPSLNLGRIKFKSEANRYLVTDRSCYDISMIEMQANL